MKKGKGHKKRQFVEPFRFDFPELPKNDKEKDVPSPTTKPVSDESGCKTDGFSSEVIEGDLT